MSGSQLLLGVKTKDFVLMVADQSDFLMGAIALKNDGTKSYKLTDSTLMMVYGQDGDPIQFAEYVQKNMNLYKFRNGYELRPRNVAHWTRRELATSLRSKNSYAVFLLLGGFDEETGGGFLAGMDYLGTQFEANYLAQGFGGRFATSILDALYREDMTQDEALDAVKSCLADVKKRCAIALPQFEIKLVNKDGIQNLGSIRV